MSTRTKRVGLLGAVAGVLAAGTAVVVAVDRSIARRRGGPDGPQSLRSSPFDRSGRVVADDGVGLYYEEVGPADAALTVVFVHGYCLALGEFVFQRRELAAHFGDSVRLLFFDQRSHGRSDHGDPERTSIDQLGRDLSSVLDTLVPNGPAVLVGHSMGGMSVLALAAIRPELFAPATGRRDRARQRVVGVALLSTSAGGRRASSGLAAAIGWINRPLMPLILRSARRQGDLIERGRALGSEFAWVLTRRLSFAGADVDPATVDYLNELIAATRIEVVADFYPAIAAHDKIESLPVLVPVPVLVVCGDHDLLTPLTQSERLVAALPHATLVVVPDAGHVALMERPEIVTDALIELIEASRDDHRPLGHRR